MKSSNSETELVASLKAQQQVLRNLRQALKDTERQDRDLQERIRAMEEEQGKGLDYEDRVRAVLQGVDHHQSLEEQRRVLIDRAQELRRLVKEGEGNQEHIEAQLRRLQAEALRGEWIKAVQAIVDALGMVSEASAEADKLRRHLEADGMHRVHRSILDLIRLADMPASRDPWGKPKQVKGLDVAKFLERAEAMGCDMSRVLPEHKQRRTA